jgi:hypothetical protein
MALTFAHYAFQKHDSRAGTEESVRVYPFPFNLLELKQLAQVHIALMRCTHHDPEPVHYANSHALGRSNLSSAALQREYSGGITSLAGVVQMTR